MSESMADGPAAFYLAGDDDDDSDDNDEDIDDD